MLFVLNKLDEAITQDIAALGGEEDKSILLVSDGVYYGLPHMLAKLESLGFEDIFAAKDAVAARGLKLEAPVELVDYDRMAEMIIDGYDRVVTL
jgi:sulfur relay protein TusB/DsrH